MSESCCCSRRPESCVVLGLTVGKEKEGKEKGERATAVRCSDHGTNFKQVHTMMLVGLIQRLCNHKRFLFCVFREIIRRMAPWHLAKSTQPSHAHRIDLSTTRLDFSPACYTVSVFFVWMNTHAHLTSMPVLSWSWWSYDVGERRLREIDRSKSKSRSKIRESAEAG